MTVSKLIFCVFGVCYKLYNKEMDNIMSYALRRLLQKCIISSIGVFKVLQQAMVDYVMSTYNVVMRPTDGI